MKLKLVNWNVEWAAKDSPKRRELQQRIFENEKPDIVCLTESHTDFFKDRAPDHSIFSQGDYGSGVKGQQRKAALWSKSPWKKTDDLAKEKELPPGRFIAGTTHTPIGEVRVYGICIPYSLSRVKGAAVKRKPWEDHEIFLNELDRILPKKMPTRTIIVGDFNQKIPRSSRIYVPPRLQAKLLDIFAKRKLVIVTTGFGLAGIRAIDHVVVSQDLVAESVRVLSNFDGDLELSDHVGIAVEISTKGA